MKHAPFIAVEGPIGAGKTTLTTMLAEELGLPVVKEIVEENPFLDKFYQNMDDWSFQLEMFFLCNRYKQLEDTVTEYIEKGKPVISDYHIYKNLIFSERTLKGTKRDKYREIYHVLTDDLPKPDIILYIRADLDTLLKRIAKRARAFEEEISKAYLQQLIEDYDDAMAQLAVREPSTVIVTIDGNKVDFVENQEDYRAIAAQLKELMK
ncbi:MULTISPECIES: deoxynucleoside kinase [unclassified Paenibacillus]|uniref:deoxynucleoside kinase n=1 Tax=unclassified Paenibacillus TaxID=185978 RepID=UPI0004F5D6F0|nr:MULTISPECIES: deoxynucleoside kinase [unclassified Paenibacillus]AIQ46353.1 deoxyguanosine kinase [Paenibacillus sp. FSL R7-0273]AIQ51955.1 deoxyguanosine kinase [Paenibacillus sp. FSL R7-0331]OMF86449.1 deoxynucleoside kinase [Paenibacillus sp. FSL R7-0273]